MRIIVAGTRTFIDQEFVCKKLDQLVKNLRGVMILVGDATGPDAIARDWAWSRGWSCEIYHAEWKELGLKAGPLRNTEMVNANAQVLIAFWNGSSAGTKDVIEKAKKKGLKVRVIKI